MPRAPGASNRRSKRDSRPRRAEIRKSIPNRTARAPAGLFAPIAQSFRTVCKSFAPRPAVDDISGLTLCKNQVQKRPRPSPATRRHSVTEMSASRRLEPDCAMSRLRKAADVLGKISRTRQLDQKRNTSSRAIDIPKSTLRGHCRSRRRRRS